MAPRIKAKNLVGKARAKKLLPFLQAMKGMKNESRGTMLGHLDPASCEALYEVMWNVLRSPEISEKQKTVLRRKLAPHQGLLMYLSNPKMSPLGKRRRLSQSGGGFLLPILSTAIPMLLSLLRK